MAKVATREPIMGKTDPLKPTHEKCTTSLPKHNHQQMQYILYYYQVKVPYVKLFVYDHVNLELLYIMDIIVH